MNRSKIIGTQAESAVRDYLKSVGFYNAERLALSGSKDRGDITGVDPRLVIEVKRAKQLEIGPWLKEAEVERINAGADIGVVWAKRRGFTDPAQWIVAMEGQAFVYLLKEMTHG